MSDTPEKLKPFSSEWYRARAEEVRHNGKTVTQYDHFFGIAEAMIHAERLEKERNEARELADDESKWAKQYFEERNEARQVADHLHMDLLLLHEEHGIKEPKELPWMK